MSARRGSSSGDQGIYVATWEGFLTAGAAIFLCTYLTGLSREWTLYTIVTGFLAVYFWILMLILLAKVSDAPAHALLTVTQRKRYRSRILAAYVIICALNMGLFVFRSGHWDNFGLWLLFGAMYGIQLAAGISQAVGSNRYEPGMPPAVTAIYERLNDDQRLGRSWRGQRRWWR